MNHRPIGFRIAVDALLLFCVFMLPWWAALAAAAVAVFFFRNFWELLLVGLSVDLLYGGGFARAWGVPFAASLAAVALYEALNRVKAHLFAYAG